MTRITPHPSRKKEKLIEVGIKKEEEGKGEINVQKKDWGRDKERKLRRRGRKGLVRMRQRISFQTQPTV